MTDIFTRLGMTIVSFAESGLTTGVNENEIVLAALVERRALARQSTLPSSPTPEDGDLYILIPGSPSPAYENYKAVYVSGGWVYIAPQDGDLFWSVSDQKFYKYDISVSPNAWVEYTASGGAQVADFIVAITDESTGTSSGTAKITFYTTRAITLTDVWASASAAVSGDVVIDVNEAGTSILSQEITINTGDQTSIPGSPAAVVSDTALAAQAKITIDVDSASGSPLPVGLKVYFVGTYT